MRKRRRIWENIGPFSVEFHHEARFRDIPYIHEKRLALHAHALSSPNTHAVIIVELKGEFVGYSFIGGGEYAVGTEAIIATVYAFYVRKKYRDTLIGGKAAVRLLRGLRKWSEGKNLTMPELEALTAKAIGVKAARLGQYNKINGAIEPNTKLFPVDLASSKGSNIWMKITVWQTDGAGCSDPESTRRGRVTQDFQVAQFFTPMALVFAH